MSTTLDIYLALEKDFLQELLEEQEVMRYKEAITEEEFKITCDAIVKEYSQHIANVLRIH